MLVIASLLFGGCSVPQSEAPEVSTPQITQEPNHTEPPGEAPKAMQTQEPTPSAKTPEPANTPAPRAQEASSEISTQSKPPAPSEEDEGLYCTLYISCATVFSNTDKISAEKLSILPQNGEIYPLKKVEFYEGETAFNVLLRETKRNKIHMEHVTAPALKSSYIKGIGNLYEYDCGELSGWTYRVNGEFPGISSSNYVLKKGDRIEFLYSCDLGRDVGNEKGGLGG